MIPHRLYLALADAQPAVERRMRAAGLVCLGAAAGPTLDPEELAGRKLLALFDRAAARDFADVRLLARRFGKDVLLARASQIDPGFDIGTLAGMIATLDRFRRRRDTRARRLISGRTSSLLRGLAIRADEPKRRLTSMPRRLPEPKAAS
jgi:hypothetical protein